MSNNKTQLHARKSESLTPGSKGASSVLDVFVEACVSAEMQEQNAVSAGLIPGGGFAATSEDESRQLRSEETEEFGAYLFGDERGLPQGEPEKNTEKEADLASDMYMHFHGGMHLLNKWIPQLQNLKSRGEYLDILKVPDHYKYAYRVISLGEAQLASLLGDKFQPGNYSPRVASGQFTLPGKFEGREHFSWTVNWRAFRDMARDWHTLHNKHSGTDYLVFARAPIGQNDFLMNPEEMEPFAEEWTYQAEVISVGPVTCDKIFYVFEGSRSPSEKYGRVGPGEKSALRNLKKIQQESNHDTLSAPPKNTLKVSITCEKLPSEEYTKVLKAFLGFCQKKLVLENIPHIFLHVKKKSHMTTGSYVRDDQGGPGEIHILVKNRLLVDVLRTLSHELTHRKQDETGMLDIELAKVDPMDEMGDLDTPYENEAYEKSGNFVKEFARTYPDMPRDELFQLHEQKKPVKNSL